MTRKRRAIDFLEERFISPAKEFIHDSRTVGIVLICCTLISLVVSNSSWTDSYLAFWGKEMHIPIPHLHLPHSIIHFINDGLMAVFFFLVGMEIKRELMVGELSTLKKSMVPIIAAVGGMVVPATMYLLWCGGTPLSKGWGIPMATDIAFSLGVLSLLGKRAPLSLRIFLTALAIIDDLGGILAIAIFYTENIHFNYLVLALATLVVLTLMNLLKVKRYSFFFLFGIILWYLMYNSGVHATISGVLLAFTIPLHKIDKLEHALHDPVNFVILPLFALANTAIVLPTDFEIIFSSIVHHGIFMGLVLGKPIGILLFSYLAVKFGIGALPTGMRWKQVLGMGMIAGIGFTMSIFIATLAFGDPRVQLVAKVAIIGASFTAGIIGFFYLKLLSEKKIHITTASIKK
ncbi:MAG: Na+/H+ antiporter NhaA [Flavipsychrobacter sp.]|jgi:NhaA family Na+:H+ antiporter|nr:Na+/H+ antiporter NhaA [Flavipsychrobacter sp.]